MRTDVVDQFLHFPDGSFAHAGQPVGLDGFIHNGFGNNCFFHRISFFLISNLFCGIPAAFIRACRKAGHENANSLSMEANLQIYAKSAEKTSSRACFSQGNRIKMQQVGNQCYFVSACECFLVRHPLQIKQLIVAGYFGAVALMFFLCRRIHARCFQEGIFLQWRSGMSF